MNNFVRVKHLVILFVVFCVLVLASVLVYQVVASPNQGLLSQSSGYDVVSYQGTLTDSSGDPVDGYVDIIFRIYNQPTDGTVLWEETHSGINTIQVDGGLLNVMLGSLTPIPDSVWNETKLYLGIQVGSDEEMSPREPINLLPPRITAGSLDADLLKPFDLGYKAFPSYWIRHGEADGLVQLHNKVTGINTTLDTSVCPSDNTWCCNTESTICIRKNSSGEDNLAIRLEESHSLACWLVHDEDDNPVNSEGLKIATNDYGSNPVGDNVPTFYILREGYLDVPIDLYASYFILCLNDAER